MSVYAEKGLLPSPSGENRLESETNVFQDVDPEDKNDS
jgi:hypothetical protein